MLETVQLCAKNVFRMVKNVIKNVFTIDIFNTYVKTVCGIE